MARTHATSSDVVIRNGSSASRRSVLVALAAALCVVAPPAARAAPTEQGVRIEGRTGTLFEGVIATDGHAVATPSDGATPRRCDGTNNGAGSTPVATPTAAADDAMRSVGMGWDGYWTPGFDDYFVQQFGPDREDVDGNASWGILVNGIYASAGGCQYRLKPQDQTLWVYGAFNRSDLLRLDGPGTIGEPTADVEHGPVVGTVQRRFTVGLGQPFVVTAIRNQATGDIGSAGYRLPAAGVRIAPVETAANGVQTIVEHDPAAVTSDASGRATLSWTTPGWKRIKATAPGFVRSNRLDVCVAEADGSGCGQPPTDVAPRPAPAPTVDAPKAAPTGTNDLRIAGLRRAPATFAVGSARVRGLRITADGHPSGLVNLRWTVVGAVRGWRVEYRVPTDRRPRWRRAGSGTTQQTTLLDLPTGKAVDLRIRFTSLQGRSVTRTIGRVVVPLDERVRRVAIMGPQRRETDPLAWRRTVTVLRRGATATVRLPDGRPTVVVRSDARPAVIELRSGASGRRQRLAVRGHADGRTLIVRGAARRSSSVVRVRVLSGVVRLDGLAVTR